MEEMRTHGWYVVAPPITEDRREPYHDVFPGTAVARYEVYHTAYNGVPVNIKAGEKYLCDSEAESLGRADCGPPNHEEMDPGLRNVHLPLDNTDIQSQIDALKAKQKRLEAAILSGENIEEIEAPPPPLTNRGNEAMGVVENPGTREAGLSGMGNPVEFGGQFGTEEEKIKLGNVI